MRLCIRQPSPVVKTPIFKRPDMCCKPVGDSTCVRHATHPEIPEPVVPVEETERVFLGLRDCLARIVKSEKCDHAVNICWCEERQLLRDADKLLALPATEKEK